MKKKIKILLGILSIIVIFYMSAKKSIKKEGYNQPPSLQGAKNACKAMGWKVSWTNSNQKAIVCTKGNVGSGSNCNKCNDWRLYVAQDGGCDMSPPAGNNCLKNKAGNYYCGHSPCRPGDNYPHGGAWANVPANNSPVQNNYSPMKRNEVKNRTYVGPSPEDKRKCEQIGRGARVCGDPQGNRCIRTPRSCRNFRGCGAHPSHCGTCMERNYKPIANCQSQAKDKCNVCNSGYNLVNNSCSYIKPIANCRSQAKYKCNVCNSGYKLVNNSCSYVIPYCQTQNGNTCSVCKSGYYLKNNKCDLITIKGCEQQSGAHCSKCGSGTELSKDRTKCIQKAPPPPVLAPRYAKAMMKPGLPGDSGPQGQKGVVGLRGLRGAKGAAAKAAQVGWVGPKGVKGIGGPKGPKGLKGERGIPGNMGIKGYRGPNTIYDPWVDNKVVDQLKKIKDKLRQKTDKMEVNYNAQRKPIDIKIQMPRKRSHAIQRKFLLEEEKEEPFSVYPPGREAEELSNLKAY